MHRVVFVDMTARAFVIIAVVYFLYTGADVFAVAWCYAAGNLLELFLSFYVLKRRFFTNPFAFAPIAQQVKMFRRALPFAFMGIFTILVNEIDKTMLSLMAGDVAVGIYGAAWQIYSRLLMINDSAFTAMFPAIVSLHAEGNRDEFFKKISNLVVMLLGITLPIAAGITLLSTNIIDLIFGGGDFSDAAEVLSILVWILPLAGISYCFYCVLFCEEKHKLMAKVNILPMLLNVGMNFLLIPKYSYTGAAVASLLTVIVRGAAFWIIAGKVFDRAYVLKKLAGLVVCVSLMSVVVWFTRSYNMFLTIAASAVVYAVLVDAVGILPVRKAVTSFFRKRRS
jgi:O-antigen/teichoic acid export membrane protein